MRHTSPRATPKLAILFSGNGSNLQNLLEQRSTIQAALAPHGIAPEFALAVSNNPAAYGITRCQKLGLECRVIAHAEFATRAEFERALSQNLRAASIDFVVLAGFMRILSAEFVQEFRAINIHPSFLPLHKGAHAIADSYAGAESFGGVSVHWVSAELDSGAIILQEKLPKIAGESLEDFERRIHELEYTLYPQALILALHQCFAPESRLNSALESKMDSRLDSRPDSADSLASPTSTPLSQH